MSKTALMGILNVTPDSFYDQGCYSTLDKAIARGIQIEQEGANYLDIGGESSRPGAQPVNDDEEKQRVIPVIQALRNHLKIPISIDTCKPGVAAAAVAAGATMINDISGFENPAMCEIAASSGVEICLMHMQGKPETMQQNPAYSEGIIPHLLEWFEKKIDHLLCYGIKKKNIIIDPGIGFGKTVADNLKIIHNLSKFRNLGFRLLLGVSRKSFMGKTLNKPPEALLSPTLAMNTIAILDRVDFIRVHDVAEHRDIIDMLEKYNCEKDLT